MRSATYALAVLLAASGHLSAASAQTLPTQSPQTDVPQAQSPQTGVPQGQLPKADLPQAQSPAQTNPVASIPNQKLDAAATAIQRIASLKRDYMQLLEDASPADQPRIVNQARHALEKAVTDQGLSVEEYASIVETAQNDPEVRQKIVERMQDPAK